MKRTARRLGSLMLCSLFATLPARAAERRLDKAQLHGYRKEAEKLSDDVLGEVFLLRQDLKTAFPQREKHVTETPSGQRYEVADSDVAFESLTPVRIRALHVTADGWLLVIVEPPAAPQPMDGPGDGLQVPRDVVEAGGVGAALDSLVYRGDARPTDAEMKECLARYPKQPEEMSRSRCGQRADGTFLFLEPKAKRQASRAR